MKRILRLFSLLSILVLMGLTYTPLIDTEELASITFLGINGTIWLWVGGPFLLLIFITIWIYAQKEIDV